MKNGFTISTVLKITAWAIIWHYAGYGLAIGLGVLDIGNFIYYAADQNKRLDSFTKIMRNVVRIGHGLKPEE